MHPWQNQLQFNISAPPHNMGIKFHRPEPIVIEKFGAGSSLSPTLGPHTLQSKTAFNFSTLSEDRLSMAVQLAKRDLQKEKENKETEKSLKKKAVGGARLKGRGYLTPKNHSPLRGKPAGRSSGKVQSQGRPGIKTSKKPKPTLPTTPPQPVVYLPPCSLSPPTRDVTQVPVARTTEEKMMQEIQRLRSEMHNCLEQIKQIQELAKKGNVSILTKAAGGRTDLPEEELEKRRLAWVDEYGARSARKLYSLQQQAKAIQADLAKWKPEEIKGDKKVQLLRRLTSAHRGAVRALQDLVNQFTEYDLSLGLPRAYTELHILMRQLSLCCAQLEIVGESGVPETVMNLLADVAETNEALEKQLHASPNRGRDKSPNRGLQRPPFEVGATSVAGPVTVERMTKEIKKQAIGATPDRETALKQGIAALLRANHVPATQQRSAPVVPPLNLPTSARQSRPPTRGIIKKAPVSSWQRRTRPGRKGNLIPSNRKPRQILNKLKEEAYSGGHYAEPTVASKLKILPPHPRSASNSPTRRPLGSPRRRGSPGSAESPGHVNPPMRFGSPRRSPGRTPTRSPAHSPGRSRSLSPGRLSGRGSPHRSARLYSHMAALPPNSPWNMAKKEIARQVWLDRETKIQARELQAQKEAELRKIHQLRSEVGPHPSRWVAGVEAKIKEQLQPLLEQAKELCGKLEALDIEDCSQEEVDAVTRAVDMDPDNMAEMILQDALNETIDDVSRLDADFEYEAYRMMDAPSVETMLQRLQDMETEQDQIRHRWATIVYEDENMVGSRRERFLDTAGSEHPRSPTPLELRRSDTAGVPAALHSSGLTGTAMQEPRVNWMDGPGPNSLTGVADPILFTKQGSSHPPHEQLHLSRLGVDNLHTGSHTGLVMRDNRVPLYITPDIVKNIEKNRKRYSEFLKRTSTQSVSRFNPWQLVEEMSDEIMDECMTDIARELEEINNDIINHVYTAEFKQIPTDGTDNFPLDT